MFHAANRVIGLHIVMVVASRKQDLLLKASKDIVRGRHKVPHSNHFIYVISNVSIIKSSVHFKAPVWCGQDTVNSVAQESFSLALASLSRLGKTSDCASNTCPRFGALC